MGAHTDAPIHYAKAGDSIDKRLLNYYIGPAQVIEIVLPRGSRILPDHLGETRLHAGRVLFKTLSFPDPYKWNDDFVALSPELIEFLALKNVRLVGIDTPSIDPAGDAALESHNAVFKHDMAILEGIILDHVSPGLYDLIALPLRIEGGDASPVRAVLMKELS